MLVRIKRMVKLNSEPKSCALNAIILYSHWRKLNSGAVVAAEAEAAAATPSAKPELHILILTHSIVFLLPLPLLHISSCFLLFSFYFLIFNTLKLNSKLFINIECILLLCCCTIRNATIPANCILPISHTQNTAFVCD